jgi:hypothetical protein
MSATRDDGTRPEVRRQPYEVTVVVDWDGPLGIVLGVNKRTGLSAVTNVVEAGPLHEKYPGLLEQHAELWALNEVDFAAFPAHGALELTSHAELEAYLVTLPGYADADGRAVADKWNELDVNGDGVITMDEFLASMAEEALQSTLAQLAAQERPYRLTFGLGALRMRVNVTWQEPLGLLLGVNPEFGSIEVTSIVEGGALENALPPGALQAGDHIAAIGQRHFHPFPAHRADLKSHKELGAFMRQLLPEGAAEPSSASIEARWKALDANGDGVISMVEFLESAAAELRAHVLDALQTHARPFTLTCVRVVPKATLDAWDREAAAEAAAAVARRTLASLRERELSAWLRNTGNGACCACFAAAHITGVELALGGVVDSAVCSALSDEQRASLFKAVTAALRDGVSVNVLHHFGQPMQHIGPILLANAFEPGLKARASNRHEVITLQLTAPELPHPGAGARASSGREAGGATHMLVDVEQYMTPLEVTVPAGVLPGDIFVVNVSRGTMDDLEAVGVGEEINVEGFSHVGPPPPGFTREHPLRTLARVGLFHLTQGKVKLAMPAMNTRNPEKELAKLRLLVRCRVLGKRWRRRTKLQWRATALERAKREAQRAAFARAHPVQKSTPKPVPAAVSEQAAGEDCDADDACAPSSKEAPQATSAVADASAPLAEAAPGMPLRGKGRTSLSKTFAFGSLLEDDVNASHHTGGQGAGSVAMKAGGASDYCYKDGDGTEHGPFPLVDLVAWMKEGYLTVCVTKTARCQRALLS